MKICRSCKRKEIQNEIHTIFSFSDKYDNFRRKALNDINEVDNINFQARYMIEKLTIFFLAVIGESL